jgi:hypothetical protein
MGPRSLLCQGLHFSLWPSPRLRAHCRLTFVLSLPLSPFYSSNSPSSSRCGNASILLGRLRFPFLQLLQPVACFCYNLAYLPSPLTGTPPSNLSRPVCASALSLPHPTSPSARSARYPPVRLNASGAHPRRRHHFVLALPTASYTAVIPRWPLASTICDRTTQPNLRDNGRRIRKNSLPSDLSTNQKKIHTRLVAKTQTTQ